MSKNLNKSVCSNSCISRSFQPSMVLYVPDVIHTVGPRGEKPDLLRSCYSKSLDLMSKNKLRSIAFPCISTGIYGYPSEAACPVALDTVRTFLDQNSAEVSETRSELKKIPFPRYLSQACFSPILAKPKNLYTLKDYLSKLRNPDIP